MEPRNCSILTIAPYRILPPRNGGQLSITYLHHYLGMACPTNLVSTADNDPADNYSFQLHPIFSTSPRRYIPLRQFLKLSSIAKAYDATAIICEHPYMALTAMALARKLKIKWYLRSQNIESERFRQLGKPWWKILAMYEEYAMELSNGVLFITGEDAEWAKQHYRIPANKAHVVPFGTTLSVKPESTRTDKERFAAEFSLDSEKKWIYFLGALDYKPNEDAVRFILDHILPALGTDAGNYQVLIGGKGLAEELQQRIETTAGITYLGFIADIDLFIKACDIMVNPVLSGGGIKTKLVEALAYNKLVVSTENGAAGIIRDVCGDNFIVTADDDWNAFAEAIKRISHKTPDIPEAFYRTYYWGNIAQKVLSIVRC